METQTNGRREFLRGAALTTAAGLAGAALLAAPAQALDKTLTYADIPTLKLLNLPGLPAGNDIKVLNYALTLEDLEADLYVQAVQRLTTGGVNKVLARPSPAWGWTRWSRTSAT